MGSTREFSPVGTERTQALGNEAYERILLAIRDRVFPPGTRVREVQIAEWLNMSRTPVRQAVQRLEAEGLLTLAPRVGLIVTEVDGDLVRELYMVRELLEGTAAGLAAQSASPSELHALQEIVSAEHETQSPDMSAGLNRRFHGLIYRSARNRFLVKSLTALHDSLALLGKSTLRSKARARQATAEHEQIVKAIVSRDAKRAEEAMRQHIQHARDERLKLVLQDTGTPRTSRQELPTPSRARSRV